VAKRRVHKGRKGDFAVRLLAKCFLLLAGVLVYQQCGQSKHYQERLRAACTAKGGKLTLSNLCIDLTWAPVPTHTRSRKSRTPSFQLEAASR